MSNKEPKSELTRYAFGYSDKKPGAAFWIILGLMVAYVLYHMHAESELDMGPLYSARTGKPAPMLTVREMFWKWLKGKFR